MEAVFSGFLQVGVDGQLQPVPFDQRLRPHLPHLTANAVDDDETVAFGAHQILIERLLDARLADDGARLCPLEFRSRQLRFRHLADVAEQMGG